MNLKDMSDEELRNHNFEIALLLEDRLREARRRNARDVTRGEFEDLRALLEATR